MVLIKGLIRAVYQLLRGGWIYIVGHMLALCELFIQPYPRVLCCLVSSIINSSKKAASVKKYSLITSAYLKSPGDHFACLIIVLFIFLL